MATSSRTLLHLNSLLECGICSEQMNGDPLHIPKLLPCCEQTICITCEVKLTKRKCPYCYENLPQNLDELECSAFPDKCEYETPGMYCDSDFLSK